MIGAGIFVLPGPAAAVAGPAVAAAFVIGGVISLLTAMSASELGTAMPKAGGSYYYINHALGPLFGSIAGWGNWMGLAFASAFYAIGFGSYINLFLTVPDLDLGFMVLNGKQLGGLAAGAFFMVVNYIGAKETGRLQNIIVITLVAILAVFVFAGIPHADVSNLTPFAPRGTGAVFSATALIFVSFLGFAKITTVAEEIRDPGRNLPRAVIGSVLIVTVIYVVIMLLLTAITPWDELAGQGDIAVVEVGKIALGGFGVFALTFGGLLATASSANASILASSRINFAMGRDQLVSPWLNAIHARFATPHRSIAVTGALIIGFILIGDIKTLAKAGAVLHLIVYGLLNLSLIVMRESKSVDYNPDYTAPWYPFVPILGALTSFGLIVFMAPMEILMSGIFVVFAAIWYFAYARRKTEKQGVLSRDILRRRDELPEQAVQAAEIVRPTEPSYRVMVPLANPAHEKDLISLASALAKERDGTVVAVHIVRVPDQTPLLAGAEALTDMQDESEFLLEQARKDAETYGVNVETHTIFSHRLFEEIFDAARTYDTDLVVIGWGKDAHGSPGRVESAYDELTQDLPCDFVVFKDRGFEPERILVPTGGGPDTELSARVAQTLATSFDGEITLFQVVKSEEQHSEAVSFLEEFAEKLDLPGAEVRVDVATDITEGITEAAKDHTMVLLGATGRGLLYRLARGTTTVDVVDAVDCSVIVAEKRRDRSLGQRLFAKK